MNSFQRIIRSITMPKHLKKYHEASYSSYEYFNNALRRIKHESFFINALFTAATLAYQYKFAEEAYQAGYSGIVPEHNEVRKYLNEFKDKYIEVLSTNFYNEYYKQEVNNVLNLLGYEGTGRFYARPYVLLEKINLCEDMDYSSSGSTHYKFTGISTINSNILSAKSFLELLKTIVPQNKYYFNKDEYFNEEYAKYCITRFKDVILMHEKNLPYVLSVGTVDIEEVKKYKEDIKTLAYAVNDIENCARNMDWRKYELAK